MKVLEERKAAYGKTREYLQVPLFYGPVSVPFMGIQVGPLPRVRGITKRGPLASTAQGAQKVLEGTRKWAPSLPLIECPLSYPRVGRGPT